MFDIVDRAVLWCCPLLKAVLEKFVYSQSLSANGPPASMVIFHSSSPRKVAFVSVFLPRRDSNFAAAMNVEVASVVI